MLNYLRSFGCWGVILLFTLIFVFLKSATKSEENAFIIFLSVGGFFSITLILVGIFKMRNKSVKTVKVPLEGEKFNVYTVKIFCKRIELYQQEYVLEEIIQIENYLRSKFYNYFENNFVYTCSKYELENIENLDLDLKKWKYLKGLLPFSNKYIVRVYDSDNVIVSKFNFDKIEIPKVQYMQKKVISLPRENKYGLKIGYVIEKETFDEELIYSFKSKTIPEIKDFSFFIGKLQIEDVYFEYFYDLMFKNKRFITNPKFLNSDGTFHEPALGRPFEPETEIILIK
tara:strand:+ start:124 stop:978 length:855 start_codon:yes stop_codon:yes gene_type:complete